MKARVFSPSELKVKRRLYAKRWRDKNPVASRASSLAWAKRNPDRVRAAHIRRTYGLTDGQFNALLTGQGSGCAICAVPFSWHSRNTVPCVDHNHVTGKVRGLLCVRCNVMLGNSQENPTILLSAIRYITQQTKN
jgi:hypothetical protein